MPRIDVEMSMFRQTFLAALGVAALVAPSVASAQGYRGDDDDRRGGDYYGSDRRFGGYPQFRGIEDHIRREIREGVREDLIERDDARDLFSQLRDIQNQEVREFRVHRWNLPDDDRYRLQDRLNRLDRLVDEIRAEPED